MVLIETNILLPVTSVRSNFKLTFLRAPEELDDIIADLDVSAGVVFLLHFLFQNFPSARQNLIFKIGMFELILQRQKTNTYSERFSKQVIHRRCWWIAWLWKWLYIILITESREENKTYGCFTSKITIVLWCADSVSQLSWPNQPMICCDNWISTIQIDQFVSLLTSFST